MKILFEKSQANGTLYKAAYFNSKPRIIMYDINIDKTLGLISAAAKIDRPMAL